MQILFYAGLPVVNASRKHYKIQSLLPNAAEP